MKTTISITLSKGLLKTIDKAVGSRRSRSAFIEQVLRIYLRPAARASENSRDLKRINRAAQRLSREAADVLEYQAQGASIVRGE
jgi:metal-responsive CopG/Arc/MetJ family transcriptional regulator